MARVKPVAEVHYAPNVGGYYVLNRRYRINRACTHVFASREEALAFARSVALLGARAATAQLNAALTAATTAQRNCLTTVKGSEMPSKPTHVWVGNPVKAEAPPKEDLLDAFGADAVHSAEKNRLRKLIAAETRPQYLRHYTRLLRRLEKEK